MSKKCHNLICKDLKSHDIDCDEVDIEAHIDSSLSCQNKKLIAEEINLTKRKGEEHYEAMYKAEYGKSAKKRCVSPVKVKSHKRACPTK